MHVAGTQGVTPREGKMNGKGCDRQGTKVWFWALSGGQCLLSDMCTFLYTTIFIKKKLKYELAR